VCVCVRSGPGTVPLSIRLACWVYPPPLCRFFGVHALPTCLNRPTFTRAVHESDLVSVILHAALDPLRVPTLLTLQSLGACRMRLDYSSIAWFSCSTHVVGAHPHPPTHGSMLSVFNVM
jgi:hypothetical protein